MITATTVTVHETVLKQHRVRGTKTTLSLKSLHGERSENKNAVAGMQVKGIKGDGNWLKLPRLYVRNDLPINKDETATQEKITEGNISGQ